MRQSNGTGRTQDEQRQMVGELTDTELVRALEIAATNQNPRQVDLNEVRRIVSTDTQQKEQGYWRQRAQRAGIEPRGQGHQLAQEAAQTQAEPQRLLLVAGPKLTL